MAFEGAFGGGAVHLGTVWAGVELRLQQMKASANEARATFAQLGRDLQKNAEAIKRDVGKPLEEIGSTMLKLGAPVALLGAAAVKTATQMDSLKRGLVAVTGSSQEAERQMRRLQEVAKLPGLGFKEAIAGSTALQAAGMSAQMAERSLRAFGNALATVGKGKADLEGVNLALTQIMAKGKLQGDELLQLMERVPQMGQVLRQAFGTGNTEQIQKMGLSVEETMERIVRQLEKLPQATGGAQNSFENFQDAATRALTAVGDAILPTVTAITDRLTAAIEGAGQRFKALPGWAKEASVGAGAGLLMTGGVVWGLGKVITGIASVAAAWKALQATMAIPILARIGLVGAGAALVAGAGYSLLNMRPGGGRAAGAGGPAGGTTIWEDIQSWLRGTPGGLNYQRGAIQGMTDASLRAAIDRLRAAGVPATEYEAELARRRNPGPIARIVPQGAGAGPAPMPVQVRGPNFARIQALARDLATKNAWLQAYKGAPNATWLANVQQRDAIQRELEGLLPGISLSELPGTGAATLHPRRTKAPSVRGEPWGASTDIFGIYSFGQNVQGALQAEQASNLRFLGGQVAYRTISGLSGFAAGLQSTIHSLLVRQDAIKRMMGGWGIKPLGTGMDLRATAGSMMSTVGTETANARRAFGATMLPGMAASVQGMFGGFASSIQAAMEKAARMREMKQSVLKSFSWMREIGSALGDELYYGLAEGIQKIFGKNPLGRIISRVMNRFLDKLINEWVDFVVNSQKMQQPGGAGGQGFMPGGPGWGTWGKVGPEIMLAAQLTDSLKRGKTGQAIGTLAGGGIGFALGGPPGMLVGSMLGGLFGGLFAEGGTAPGRKWSVVGERGPELIYPAGPTSVVPLGRGGGASVNVTLNVSSGLDVVRVSEAIAAHTERALRTRVGR